MITLLVITPDFFNWLKKLLITKVSAWLKSVLHSTQKWNRPSKSKVSQTSTPMVIVTPGYIAESKTIINSVMPHNGLVMHQKLTPFQHQPPTQEPQHSDHSTERKTGKILKDKQ